MRGINRYGAAAAKIRGMRSHLLTTEDYVRLANCGSIKEMTAVLKTYPSYAQILADIDVENMRREHMERLVFGSALRDFEKISHFLDRDAKALMRALPVEYELRLINNIIREIFNKRAEPTDFSIYRVMYEHSPDFDFDKVIKADSIDALIAALEGSAYREPIYRTRHDMPDAVLFDYETAINRFYFTNLWALINGLDHKVEKKAALLVYGSEIDLLNIMWIYRAKAFYDLSSQQICSFLIPVQYKLTRAQTAAMLQAQSAEDVLKIAMQTPYSKRLDMSDPATLEKTYRSYIVRLGAAERRNHPYSFIVIAAYAFDKKVEAEAIIRIAESVRYGYDPKRILNALNIQR